MLSLDQKAYSDFVRLGQLWSASSKAFLPPIPIYRGQSLRKRSEGDAMLWKIQTQLLGMAPAVEVAQQKGTLLQAPWRSSRKW